MNYQKSVTIISEIKILGGIMTNSEYLKMVGASTDKSPLLKDLLSAFVFGGGICCLGQALRSFFETTDMTDDEVKIGVSVSLIVLTAILTSFGVFDKIAKVAGAGTFVPITGFANSVISPAVEFSAEGRILGTGAKMFNLAGPVIVYGCTAACIYGLIIYIFGLV